jgi:hypothetical protein
MTLFLILYFWKPFERQFRLDDPTIQHRLIHHDRVSLLLCIVSRTNFELQCAFLVKLLGPYYCRFFISRLLFCFLGQGDQFSILCDT